MAFCCSKHSPPSIFCRNLQGNCLRGDPGILPGLDSRVPECSKSRGHSLHPPIPPQHIHTREESSRTMMILIAVSAENSYPETAVPDFFCLWGQKGICFSLVSSSLLAGEMPREETWAPPAGTWTGKILLSPKVSFIVASCA